MLTDTAQLAPARWNDLFVLLSLDVILPFHRAMRLLTSHPVRLVTIVRPYVTALDAALDVAHPNGPAIEIPTDAVFADVAREMGDADARALLGFATNTFSSFPLDRPHWYGWDTAFAFAEPSEKKRRNLALPAELRNAVFDAYSAATDLSSVETEIHAVKQRPLSDWDLDIYTRYRFYAEDINDPFDDVLSTIKLIRFREFMTWLVRTLSESALDALHQSARDRLAADGVRLREPLRHPRDLFLPGA